MKLPSASGFRPWVWAAVAAGVILAGAGGFLLSRSGGGAGTAPTQLNFSRLTDQEGSETFPSLSPDGDELVYVRASWPGNLDIWHQRVGGSNPRNLTADSDSTTLSRPSRRTAGRSPSAPSAEGGACS